MQEFRVKMQDNGRVVIPAACRKALNISKGEELIISIDNEEEARIFSLKHAIREAQKLVKRYNKDGKKLSEELIQERREEAKNE